MCKEINNFLVETCLTVMSDVNGLFQKTLAREVN
jgi:hypothetical protein